MDRLEFEKLKESVVEMKLNFEKMKSQLNQEAIQELNEIIKEKEDVVTKHLDLIVDKKGENYFYKLVKNNDLIVLNDYFAYQLEDEPEVWDDDLVLVFGNDAVGLFSFDRKEVLIPLIAREINLENEFIYVDCMDNSVFQLSFAGEVNPENDFLYLYQNGSFFQNEGHPSEKINDHFWILHQSSGDGNYVFYGYSDILIHDIMEYDVYDNEQLIILQTRNEQIIFDLVESKVIKTVGNLGVLKVESFNFFSHSYSGHTKVFNRDGAVLFVYTLQYYDPVIKYKDIQLQDDDKQFEQRKEEFLVVLNSEIYIFNFEDICFYSDYISIKTVIPFLNKGAVLLFQEWGEFKILEIDLKKMNKLVGLLLNKSRFQGNERHQLEYDLKKNIENAKQYGVNIELLNVLKDDLELPRVFDRQIAEEIQLLKMSKAEEELKYGLEDVTNYEILDKNGVAFKDGTYFIVGKNGQVFHLQIDNVKLWCD